MVAAYRASTISGASDVFQNNNVTNVPTNLDDDQMYLIAVCWHASLTPTVTNWAALGFTEIFSGSVAVPSNGNVFLRIARKEIGPSADTGTYTVNYSTTTWNQLVAISGSGLLIGADPLDVAINSATGNSVTTIPTTTVVTTDSDLLFQATASYNAATATAATNFTERQDGDVLHVNTWAPGSSGSKSAASGTVSVSTHVVTALMAVKPPSSATNLVINDATSPTSTDAIALTQTHMLAVADATSGTSTDAISLTQIINLIVQKAMQPTSTDAVNLSQVHQLAIFDALHTTKATTVVLASGTTLVIQKASQATSTDGIALVQTHNLQIQDATHATLADVVQLVLPGFGGFMTVSDVQLQKLQVATGKTGTMADLEFAYYSGLSGLVPVAQFSVTDHQRKYWETQTGLTGRSMADLEKAFYDGLLIAAGSLADREFTYWTGL